MKKLVYILFLGPFLVVSQYGIQDTLKACPGCFGFGSNATGGRNGILYIVDTLNDEAPAVYHPASGGNDEYYTGGLRAALLTHSVGHVVFNVSGPIDIGDGGTPNWPGGTGRGIYVKNKTIYGQSAPRGGITITGGSFRMGGFNADQGNIIMRHIRSRPIRARGGETPAEAAVTDFNAKYGITAGGVGDDAYTWAFIFSGGNNIMLDHVSGSFAYDKVAGGAIRQENVTSPGCPCTMQDITFQNSIFGEGSTNVYFEVNPNRPNNPEQYQGRISLLRTVMVGTNRTANWAFDGEAEQINTVVDRAASKNSRIYHNIELNMLGNWYRGFHYNWLGPLESGKTPRVYARRNFLENESINIGGYNSGNINLTGDNSEDNDILFINQSRNAAADPAYLASTEFDHGVPNPITELTPQEAFTELVINKNVGAYLYLDDNGDVQVYRDSYDTEMLERVENNTIGSYNFRDPDNFVLPNIPQNTRPTNYDTDNDGMCDAWEIREFGDLSQSYRDDFDGDGYENIEEYMNQVDGTTSLLPTSGILNSRRKF